jgi:hypothetical protein
MMTEATPEQVKDSDIATMTDEDGNVYVIELKPGETGFDPETTSG